MFEYTGPDWLGVVQISLNLFAPVRDDLDISAAFNYIHQ